METSLKKRFSSKLSDKAKEHIADGIVYAFIILFVYTAASKIQTFRSFEYVLGQSILIGKYNTLVAYTIPSAEILISSLLIIPFTRKKALAASLVLMIIFTLYLIYMVNSGSRLICSCGGVLNNLTWNEHIWFNIAFIALAAAGLLLYKIRKLSIVNL